jgi:hypothetical protein
MPTARSASGGCAPGGVEWGPVEDEQAVDDPAVPDRGYDTAAGKNGPADLRSARRGQPAPGRAELW